MKQEQNKKLILILSIIIIIQCFSKVNQPNVRCVRWQTTHKWQCNSEAFVEPCTHRYPYMFLSSRNSRPTMHTCLGTVCMSVGPGIRNYSWSPFSDDKAMSCVIRCISAEYYSKSFWWQDVYNLQSRCGYIHNISKCKECWCIREIMHIMYCLTKWLQAGYAHAVYAPPQQFSVCFAFLLKLNRIIRWKRYIPTFLESWMQIKQNFCSPNVEIILKMYKRHLFFSFKAGHSWGQWWQCTWHERIYHTTALIWSGTTKVQLVAILDKQKRHNFKVQVEQAWEKETF